MASISVVTVTSAWLLAELSTSPLINSLLIGAQNLPALLPLARTIKGVRVFIGATFLLELIVVCLYFQLLPNWVLIVSTLMVVLLASCGSITSASDDRYCPRETQSPTSPYNRVLTSAA